MAPRRPRLVELVGLAGSGKSTLARELAAREPDVRIGVPLSRAASATAQAVAVAPFVAPYLRECRGTPWFGRGDVRGLGYLQAWHRSLTRPATADACVVLDHGPLFRLARLDTFGPPVTTTTRYRRWRETTLDEWADLLDVVVWLDAPDEVLLRRIRGREQRHVLRSAGDEASRTFLRDYRASYAGLLERVRERSPGAVLALRTDQAAPPELATEVLRRLRPQARLRD